jgi:putative proteasome-type protease
VVGFDTLLMDGVKLVLISMDSTLRSNLLVYRADGFGVTLRRRITDEDPNFRAISEGWSLALRNAYLALPRPDWLGPPPTG